MADRRLAWALAAVIVRYLTTIQPHARRELARWRQRAHAIPDPELRAHVLRPFDADMSAEGAALFAVLAPRRQERQLVPLLVAYVLLWSYVDVRTERDPHVDPRLADVLVDALRPDVSAPLSDGYLVELTAACRRRCAALPAWGAVAPVAQSLAEDGRAVQAINHGPPFDIERCLRAWAGAGGRRHWHESSAAASSPLMILALMALAANRRVTPHVTSATAATYRSISALGVLCDHLIDQPEDRALANHSYLRYYTTPVDRARGIGALAETAHRDACALDHGKRHTVLLAAMVAMFLSDEKAWTAESAPTSHAVLNATGAPAHLLLTLARGTRRTRRT